MPASLNVVTDFCNNSTTYIGIEKGYEEWLEGPSDDEQFEEKGINPDEEDEIVFNVRHTVGKT